jgi:hypothetical protein
MGRRIAALRIEIRHILDLNIIRLDPLGVKNFIITNYRHVIEHRFDLQDHRRWWLVIYHLEVLQLIRVCPKWDTDLTITGLQIV